MTEETKNILERKVELQKFLGELEEIRREPDHRLHPIAGTFEQQELDKINKILEAMGYPT